ncbi:transmembrane amino acid transporter protein-domain-containing protein [Dimargaris cristalligena]|uniref:Transmembrane amino acid transporter protein-domain-containing protein n=1 Tax=Dimargaris cristalligena TaxID=215637 RepID=A0A4Q0A2M7_9FUNG|nr:transmembrane amino acid transporter protein-domain-containing protein [Dimargaris cristalligena]|eukprot:RKP40088.1 transmembrane amino acid transporter protein-domain-containing protein [Dimargaris cristalligena]
MAEAPKPSGARWYGAISPKSVEFTPDELADGYLAPAPDSQSLLPGSSTESFVKDHAKGSNAAAVFHIMCVMAGTGILQLPYCLKQGGWLSLFWIVLAAVVSNYTGIIFIRSLYTADGRRLNSFSEVAGAAFGPHGRRVTRVFKDVSSVGTCTLFMILAGYNLNAIFTPDAALAGVRYWIIICSVVVTVPYVIMRTIQDAVIMSIFGAATTGLMVIVVVGLGIVDLPNHPTHAYQWVDVWGFPLALSSICFSFGGNVVWPQVEQGLRDPKAWPRVLTTATTIVCIMYLLVAIVGYAVYDSDTLSPVFLNLPQGLPLAFANVMVTIHVLMTTPIMLTSVSSEFEDELAADYPRVFGSAGLGKPGPRPKLRAAVRIPLMIITMLCAVFVPFFADVMALLGSLIYSTLIFVFPVLIYYKLQGWHLLTGRTLLWNVVIIVIGVLCCSIGSYQAILALIRDFQTSL